MMVDSFKRSPRMRRRINNVDDVTVLYNHRISASFDHSKWHTRIRRQRRRGRRRVERRYDPASVRLISVMMIAITSAFCLVFLQVLQPIHALMIRPSRISSSSITTKSMTTMTNCHQQNQSLFLAATRESQDSSHYLKRRLDRSSMTITDAEDSTTPATSFDNDIDDMSSKHGSYKIRHHHQRQHNSYSPIDSQAHQKQQQHSHQQQKGQQHDYSRTVLQSLVPGFPQSFHETKRQTRQQYMA